VAAAAAVCRWISWWIWAGWDLCWRWWRWVWRFIFFDGFEAEDAQVIEGDVAGEAEFDDSDGVEVLDVFTEEIALVDAVFVGHDRVKPVMRLLNLKTAVSRTSIPVEPYFQISFR